MHINILCLFEWAFSKTQNFREAKNNVQRLQNSFYLYLGERHERGLSTIGDRRGQSTLTTAWSRRENELRWTFMLKSLCTFLRSSTTSVCFSSHPPSSPFFLLSFPFSKSPLALSIDLSSEITKGNYELMIWETK